MKDALTIQCKELGRTHLRIPELGLGTWGFHAGPDVLRAGLEAGVRFIDTAESYGTESVVGAAIAHQRDGVFLATKVSPQNFRRADLIKAADASLQRLGTDHIDLYQLHQPNDSVPIGETIAALEELIDVGKVRFLGVSNFSVAQMCLAQRALRKHPLVSNQVRFSLVDRTITTDILPWCKNNGVTVIAYSPLAREFQRIRDGDPHGVLATIARETGCTPAQIALNWCLSHDQVVAIPKSNSLAHVRENCGASGWRLSAEQFRRLDESILFRRRGALDRLVRRYTPRGLIGLFKTGVRFLPQGIRRRVT
jgi:diketogulonate reductase-like aldo/keto reductase